MNKTYAYNSIIFGALFGVLAGVKTDSMVFAAALFLAVSIVGFILIRMFEKAVDKGVNKAADKISEIHNRRKTERMNGGSAYQDRETTRMPEER